MKPFGVLVNRPCSNPRFGCGTPCISAGRSASARQSHGHRLFGTACMRSPPHGEDESRLLPLESRCTDLMRRVYPRRAKRRPLHRWSHHRRRLSHHCHHHCPHRRCSRSLLGCCRRFHRLHIPLALPLQWPPPPPSVSWSLRLRAHRFMVAVGLHRRCRRCDCHLPLRVRLSPPSLAPLPLALPLRWAPPSPPSVPWSLRRAALTASPSHPPSSVPSLLPPPTKRGRLCHRLHRQRCCRRHRYCRRFCRRDPGVLPPAALRILPYPSSLSLLTRLSCAVSGGWGCGGSRPALEVRQSVVSLYGLR